MRNPPFPGCNCNREKMNVQNHFNRRPRHSAPAPQIRIRHPRQQAHRLRRPRLALGPQTLLHPLPASRRTCLEGRRRCQLHERRGGTASRRRDAGRDPAGGGCASSSRRDPLRDRRRDRVRTPPADLEGANARGEPGLPAQPDPALLLGTPDCRRRQPGGPQLVRLAPRYPGRGRSLHAGALRHHEGGGSDGPSSRGLQPLPGHPALSPEREGALPVRRRDSPPVRSIVCPCRTKAASSRGHPSFSS